MSIDISHIFTLKTHSSPMIILYTTGVVTLPFYNNIKKGRKAFFL